MEASDDRHVWLRRLRWRLRGAWQAPAFALFTAVDAVILQLLPFQGDEGPGVVASVIIAGVLNLIVVAVVGPLASLGLRRRDAALPAFAARDRAGVWALFSFCVVLLAGGLVHRPSVADEQDKLVAQAVAARQYFGHVAPAEYRSNLDRMDTWKAGPDLYRTCVPGRDAARDLCVYVKTDRSPPGVTRDRSQEPNAVLTGSGAAAGPR